LGISSHPPGEFSLTSAGTKNPGQVLQYAAFRIAATPGNEREKNGLVIAMTPLDKNAP
jgi:hypothetical protein